MPHYERRCRLTLTDTPPGQLRLVLRSLVARARHRSHTIANEDRICEQGVTQQHHRQRGQPAETPACAPLTTHLSVCRWLCCFTPPDRCSRSTPHFFLTRGAVALNPYFFPSDTRTLFARWCRLALVLGHGVPLARGAVVHAVVVRRGPCSRGACPVEVRVATLSVAEVRQAQANG